MILLVRLPTIFIRLLPNELPQDFAFTLEMQEVRLFPNELPRDFNFTFYYTKNVEKRGQILVRQAQIDQHGARQAQRLTRTTQRLGIKMIAARTNTSDAAPPIP